jgi:MYND finger
MEEDFVEDGMKFCLSCLKVPYCSAECMAWDWSNGGHREVCVGLSTLMEDKPALDEIVMTPEVNCAACGMDSEFVPEGMLSCDCNKVIYCSRDCQQCSCLMMNL